MSWSSGNRARCIRVHPWRNAGLTEIPDHETPTRGETYTVEGVMMHGGVLALCLEGFCGWFDSCEFVKVPPLAVEVAVNRETATIGA